MRPLKTLYLGTLISSAVFQPNEAVWVTRTKINGETNTFKLPPGTNAESFQRVANRIGWEIDFHDGPENNGRQLLSGEPGNIETIDIPFGRGALVSLKGRSDSNKIIGQQVVLKKGSSSRFPDTLQVPIEPKDFCAELKSIALKIYSKPPNTTSHISVTINRQRIPMITELILGIDEGNYNNHKYDLISIIHDSNGWEEYQVPIAFDEGTQIKKTVRPEATESFVAVDELKAILRSCTRRTG